MSQYSNQVELKYSINYEFRIRTPKANVGSIRIRINHQGQNIRYAVPALVNTPLYAWDTKTNSPKPGSREGDRLFSIISKTESNISEFMLFIQLNLYRKGHQLFEKGSDFPYNPIQTLNNCKSLILDSQYVYVKGEYLYQKYSDFVDEKIQEHSNNGNPLGNGTIKQYRLTCRIIEEFETKYGKITLKEMDSKGNSDFTKRFMDFLKVEKNYKESSMTKLFKQFNAFIIQIQSRNNLPFELRKLSYKGLDSGFQTKIVLTFDEIEKIHHLSGLSENLEEIRKLLIIGIWTGLRFSDWHKIENYHPSDEYLIIKSTKTKSECCIPITDQVRPYLDYFFHNRIPSYIKNTNMNSKVNEKLKKLLKEANIDRMIQISETDKLPIHEVFSTHNCRATFITIMLLLGIETTKIMKMTGHKNEKEIKTYASFAEKEFTADIRNIINKPSLSSHEPNNSQPSRSKSHQELRAEFENIRSLQIDSSNSKVSAVFNMFDKFYQNSVSK